MDKFIQALAGAYATHPKALVLEKENQEVFKNLFAGWPEQMLVDAVKSHMMDPKAGMYLITPAHLTAQLEKMVGIPGENAWRIVERAAADHGINDDIKFADPCIMQSIADCGGWRVVCMESNQWKRGEVKRVFVEAYNRYFQYGLRHPPPESFAGSLVDKRLKVISWGNGNALGYEVKMLELDK